ncbi:MAG: SpoIIE family protein phosphatase [Spirochaetales bacterium]|jgi:serine phosphatase RsbU (regulator of sigma subunit)|nr:SpoIIE family protein phosphatase [Spirochaetales bacterium]
MNMLLGRPLKVLLMGLLLCIGFASPLCAQILYWEAPERIGTSPGGFPQAVSGGGLMAFVWQEVQTTGTGQGNNYICISTTRDGQTWTTNQRFAGPYPFFGDVNSIFSVAMSGDGEIFLAVLSGASSIDFFMSSDGGATFSKSNMSFSLTTTIAPRLFRKAGGGFLLFVTRELNEILSIFYARSPDGLTWSEFQPFAPEPELTLSFLPQHASFQGREYVVFQSLRTGGSGSYQLYLKISSDGGITWRPFQALTDFSEMVDGNMTGPGLFDNQRPHISPVNGNLAVAWERRYQRGTKNIYYMEIDATGRGIGPAEAVTSGLRVANFPQIIRYNNSTYLVWFDNRMGTDHIILAVRNGVLWEDSDISPMRGASTFGRPVINGNELYILWENRMDRNPYLYYLKPDTTVSRPEIIPVNFTRGRRSSNREVRLRWVNPSDSSGIAGYIYEWSRDPQPRPGGALTVLENVRSASFTADEDGPWYFHITAQDYAGNRSQPVTLMYERDTTPPGIVRFTEQETDEEGYLVSNTFSLAWEAPAEDEDIAGYTYSFTYVGPGRDALRGRPAVLPDPPRTLLLQEPSVSFQNNDNGLWQLSVAAIDTVGNIGPKQTMLVALNKYQPITYISLVRADKDLMGRIHFSLIGRGFNEEGEVSRVILDRDGKEPWDYVFYRTSGAFTIGGDRNISGPIVPDIQTGNYYIGVLHPERGLAFAGNMLRLERSGIIKFGDYTIYYDPGMQPVQKAPLILSGEILMLGTLLVFLAFTMIFSITRIGELVNEGRRLRLEAVALVMGNAAHWVKKQERMRVMKRKGLGLRLKFTFFITVLVISVVLLVSVPLGVYMSANDERNLAAGLYERVSVLLESLATGARTYLPTGTVLELIVLPRQISAMSEAEYATITGRSQNDIASYGYVWASNDPDIASKIDTQDINPGVTRIHDEISDSADELAAQINEEAQAAVADIAAELDRLSAEARGLVSRTDAVSQARLTDTQNAIRTLQEQFDENIASLSQTVRAYPEFRIERHDYSDQPWYKRFFYTARDMTGTRILDPNILHYTFYKPVLYRITGVNTYFRGLIRLGVSTEDILAQLDTSRRILVMITAGIALLAVIIGVGGAMILASITIIPIRRLVQGVEKISATEDKETLRDYAIDVKTRDEINDLAQAINQMTRGLARAAAASKDLTVGKEIQKMFIPLEVGASGKKMTTGSIETKDVEFFGYYEGAKGVSGDYFEYHKLDDDHYAFIKCDVSGKGVPAALIMVQVATVFISYFKDHDMTKGRIDMVPLLYRINDIVESLGFKGRFAAMTLGVLNVKSGISNVTHAGDRILNIYDSTKQVFAQRMMNDSPATGVFPNFMVEMRSPFEQTMIKLNPGDINMLFTDGVEESHRKLRKPNFEIMQLPPEKEGDEPIEDEMLGNDRIKDIFEAAMNRGKFLLEKADNPVPNEQLLFDFSGCDPSAETVVKALVSVEKIWRTYPHPGANENDRIMIDKVVDEFLQKTFARYSIYYSHPINNPNPEEYPNYNFYTHLREDDQYDDLTLLAVRKK